MRARLAELDLAEIDERLGEVEERRAAAALERKRDRRTARGAARRAQPGRGGAGRRRRARRGRDLRALPPAQRARSGSSCGARPRSSLPSVCGPSRRLPRSRSNPEREALREQARLTRERLGALEHSLAEREGLPPAARALAEEGEQLALSLLEVEAGYERAVARAPAGSCGDRADARGAGARRADARRARRPRCSCRPSEAPSRARARHALEPVQARPGGERVAELLADSGSPSRATSLARERRPRDARGALLRRRARRALVRRRDGGSGPAPARRAPAGASPTRPRSSSARPRRADPAAPVPLQPLVALAERLAAALARRRGGASGSRRRFARTGGRGQPRRPASSPRSCGSSGGAEAEVRRVSRRGRRARGGDRRRAGARWRPSASEARAPARGGRRRARGGRRPRGARRPGSSGSSAAARRSARSTRSPRRSTSARRSASTELADAARGPRGEPRRSSRSCATSSTETVERRFDGDLRRGQRPLRRGRRDALPGRRGAAAADRARARGRRRGREPGVEVELRPAGKRVTRLSLLSGGEKALGAISFLFALFLARPCPFYLLDEVEAALDDANIGRFVELLRRYADRAQFIVVTHQKKTMEAADILYGVTMGGDGVSQIVSRRLPREAGARLLGVSRTLGRAPRRRRPPRRDARTQSQGFFSRLRDSLGKSRRALTEQLAAAAFDPADDEAWERLEEALIAADVGVPDHGRARPAARGAGRDRASWARRSPRRAPRCSASPAGSSSPSGRA